MWFLFTSFWSLTNHAKKRNFFDSKSPSYFDFGFGLFSRFYTNIKVKVERRDVNGEKLLPKWPWIKSFCFVSLHFLIVVFICLFFVYDFRYFTQLSNDLRVAKRRSCIRLAKHFEKLFERLVCCWFIGSTSIRSSVC